MEWSTTGKTPSEPHFENGVDYGGKLRRWQRSRVHSHASMDWSPCRLRLELDLVLARKLARPDAFESLPRLVVALRGVQQVNDRVDLLEVEPDRTTAEVDSLLKQLDNYWKSSKDYYDDDEHCRGRNYFWDAPDLQCDY